jgi:peptide/nickel transport system substrate-binding protein
MESTMANTRTRGRGRWFRASTLLGLIAALGVTACGSNDGSAGNGGSTTAATGGGAPVLTAKCPGFPSGPPAASLEAIGNRGGDLVEGHPTPLETLNPLAGGFEPWVYSTEVIFDKLIDVNPNNGLLYPVLATQVPTPENGGVSKDGLTYTFKLRPGVKWADGTPFTAEDVAYEYGLLANPKTASPFTSQVNDRIASVTAKDPQTVVFQLKRVVTSFLYQNMYGIAPKEILSKYSPSKLASSPFAKGDPAETFGTGPFRFEKIQGGNTLILKKNPNYFCGEPALDHYVYQATSDSTANLQLLQSGQINLALIATTDEGAAKSAGLKTFSYSTVFSTNLLFNLDASHVTGDQKVRQALMYGMDRKEVLAGAGGDGELTNGLISIKSFAHTEDINPTYTLDLDKAQQLLAEAGWKRSGNGPLEKDGQPLRIALWTNSDNPTRKRVAAVLQQQWARLGAQVSVNLEDFASLGQRYQSSGNYDVVVLGLYHSIDPDDMSQFYATKAGQNFNHYSNPRVDALLREGVGTGDSAKRKAIYTQAQDLVAADVTMPTLWFNVNVRAISPRLHNVIPNGIALDVNRWNAGSWWISK